MRSGFPSSVLLPAFFFGFSLCFAQTDEGNPTSSIALPILEAAATGDLKKMEAQKVIVYGETADSIKSQSGTNLVNFKGAEFYLVTFKSDLEPFKQGEPSDIFNGKRVAVTGVISIYQDKPQIKLTSPDQVRILQAEEIFPPEAPDKTVGTEEEGPDSPPAVAESPEALEPEPPRENPPIDWRKFFK